jgi:AraC-like DNA-binding protein
VLPGASGSAILSAMILAPVNDLGFQATVRRAALPDEDVLHGNEEILRGLHLGFPRLVVCRTEDLNRLPVQLQLTEPRVPVLAVGSASLKDWERTCLAGGLAVRPIDAAALRLRGLMQGKARGAGWVDRFFSDLTALLGRGLPVQCRGLARRVLEFPSRYPSLQYLRAVAGLSPGALKARFRRRGLPSPSRYLRWFRVMAAARILSDPGETTLTSSYRLGFGSDGNFCRWVQGTSGFAPSLLRSPGVRMLLMVRLVEECFPEGAVDRWMDVSGIFLRKVA